jgi:glycosyltransferase involved in cell wall biosynthesis
MLSLIVPVYSNEENLPALLELVGELNDQTPIEAVFVVDGSPDRSAEILQSKLPEAPFPAQLIQLSRNFGSFAAICAGLRYGAGDYFAILAADLQEPPELILQFLAALKSGEVDVAVGERIARDDPWFSRVAAGVFWRFFRTFAVQDTPPGGVDTFGCTRQFRDSLLSLNEVDSSLVSLVFWLGFRRRMIPYVRRKRMLGKSAWSLRKKIDYAIYSVFNFTDLPIRLVLASGALACAAAIVMGSVVLFARLTGLITAPGYSALALLITFFGGLTTFSLGVVGQ